MSKILVCSLIFVFLFGVSIAFAGTTVIEIAPENETGGTAVHQDGNPQDNMYGAMFWAGGKWSLDSDYAHMYFRDIRTKGYLKDYNTTTIKGGDVEASTGADWEQAWQQYTDDQDAYDGYVSDLADWQSDKEAWEDEHPGEEYDVDPPDTVDQPSPPAGAQQTILGTEEVYNENGYKVTLNRYRYSIAAKSPDPGASSTSFVYDAAEYVVEQPDGKKIILKSRGSGSGADSNLYFNVYIEDKNDTTATAFRGDPVWFNYDKNAVGGIEGAALMTDGINSSNKYGDLPSYNATYFLDEKGGSDLGGSSYQFNTSTFTANATFTTNLGSSFATDFSIKYMDSNGFLQELKLEPHVYSEEKQNTYPSCCCDASL